MAAYDQSLSFCAGPASTTTDEAGNTHANCTDGLGQLISVAEPDPASGSTSTGTVTSYSYDMLGNLVTVDVAEQQLAIARALASGPRVCCSTSRPRASSPRSSARWGGRYSAIRDREGLSILVSEQVLSFALDIADRVLVIEDGEIVHEEARGAIDEAKVAGFLSV